MVFYTKLEYLKHIFSTWQYYMDLIIAEEP